MSGASPVSREFTGLARDLRQVLAADDIVAFHETGRIAAPFAPLVRSGAAPRPEMLAKAAHAWETRVPATGRLRLEIDLRKKSLHIRELRVLAATTSFAAWAEGATEPGFAVAAMELVVAPPKFRLDPVMLASVSLHAVERWHQRSFRNTRAALLADLGTLAMAATDETVTREGRFEITAGDGRWACVAMEDETGERILCARSFLTH